MGKQWRGGSPLFAVATVHAASRAGLTFATSKQLPGAYGGRGPGSQASRSLLSGVVFIGVPV